MSSRRKRGGAITLGIQSVVAVCLFIPTCSLEQSGQCSDESKYIVLDYDDLGTYNITHGVCKDGATCECLPGDQHSISKAYIYDRNRKEYELYVSNDRHHFNVVLPNLNKPLPGVHTYSFGYDYECPYFNLHSTCYKGKSKEMNLTIKIVDYRLRADDTGSVVANTSREENLTTLSKEFEIGGNVTLLCASSLTGVNDSVLDIPVVFAFKMSGTNSTKSGVCHNKDNITTPVTTEANWIISRQSFPPYDCILTIVDCGSKDVGEYQCAGLLPRDDDSQYEKDWSKVTIKLLNRDLPPKGKSNHLSLISIAAVLFLIVPVLIIIIYKIYRKSQYHLPLVTPASSTTSLVSHRSLQQNYGGALSTESISNRGDEQETKMAQHTCTVEVSVEEPSQGGGNSRASSQNIHQSQEGTHTSTISAGTEGRQYYEQYTDILYPDGRQTPENSEAPPNENFKCHHCGKIYHDDQRLFYARHMNEGQQRCPNYKGEAGTTTTNKNTPNTAQLSDSLTIGPSSGGPRSRGSTMSEIREGKEYYIDHMEVQVPNNGPTPEESEVPLDDNYKCPLCGKTYRENQRLYFKRHVDELQYRCPKYDSLMAARGSSGSFSPEQSV